MTAAVEAHALRHTAVAPAAQGGLDKPVSLRSFCAPSSLVTEVVPRRQIEQLGEQVKRAGGPGSVAGRQ